MRKRFINSLLSIVLLLACLNLNVKVAAYSTTKDFSNPGYSDSVNPYPLYCYGVLANCTWYAWGRAYEKGYALPYTNWGNAEQWLDSAKQAGYTTSMTPKANSIAVWTTSQIGHVAYVESVSGTNVTISESNVYVEKNGPILRYHSDTYTANALKTRWGNVLIGYIHLDESSATPTLTAGVGSIYDSSVLLKWTNSSDYQGGYWIRRATSENGAATLVKEIGNGSTHTWIDTSAEPGKRYWYTVQAFSSNRTGGPYTNKVAIRTLGELHAESEISNSRDTTEIKLNWGEFVDYTTGFIVKRSNSPTGPWTTLADLTNKEGDNIWIDKTVVPGQTYYYRVQSYKDNHSGGPHTNTVQIQALGYWNITPTATKRLNNTLYEVYDYPFSWEDAKAYCESIGGHLVTITSASENSIVSDLITSGTKNFYAIGAESIGTQGIWRWTNGESFDYSNWDPQLPEGNTSGEPYSYIMARNNAPNKQIGEWTDGLNKYKTIYNFYHYLNGGFVCEREVIDIEFDLQGGKMKPIHRYQDVSHINGSREGLELVVYDKDNTVVNTNTVGYEAAVNNIGKVMEIRAYGEDKQLKVPSNGFVVSGQYNYNEACGADFTKNLSVNQYVGFDEKEMRVYSYSNYDTYLYYHKYVGTKSKYGVLPVPEKDGYYFNGWYTKAEGGIRITEDSDYQGNILYAQWVEKLEPAAVLRNGDTIYEVYDNNLNWEDAKLYAEDINAHLVTITSEAENELINNLTKSGTRGYYAIGAESLETAGEWNWVTGEEFDYSNWDLMAPEGISEKERYAYIISKYCPPNKEIGEWCDGYNSINFGQSVRADFYYYENGGFITEGNVMQLKNKILEAKSISSEGYTDESYTKLERILEEAQNKVDEKDLTLSETNDLTIRLTQAIRELQEEYELKVDKVKNLKAEPKNYKDVFVSWDEVELADYYLVERAVSGGQFSEYGTIEGNTLEVTVKTGKEYQFRVKAIYEGEDGQKEGEWSDIASVRTSLSGKPVLTLEKNGNTRFDLSWTKVDGATRYIIYRKPNDGSYQKVLTLGGDVLKYTTNVMKPGRYYFIVKAGRYDSKDRVMTDSSNAVSGTSKFISPVITIAKASSTSAEISWKPVEGLKYYEIYRSTSKSGVYKKLKTTTSTSFTNKSLVKNKTYYYKVKGYRTMNDQKVYSSYSSVESYTVK